MTAAGMALPESESEPGLVPIPMTEAGPNTGTETGYRAVVWAGAWGLGLGLVP